MSNAVGSITMSDKKRQQELRFLLLYTFIMVTGFFMLMPLVAVHFVNNVGMTATLVGLALAVRQLTQQGLTVLGGLMSDHFGIKPVMCCGVLLRAVGFAALAWTNSPWLLFFALIISALGGALFEAPYQASIITLTNEKERSHYYLLSNLVGGVASTVGPLLGIALLQYDFQAVCFGAAACFLVNFLIAIFLLPSLKKQPDEEKESLLNNIHLVMKNKKFIFFIGVMMGYWFTAMQVNISFPLWAEKITGNQESVGVMYALSAAITVLLQYPLVKWLERWLAAHQILTLGMAIMSIAIGMIAWANNFSLFLVCIAIFTLGVLLTRPTQQSITAALANKNALGTFMGVSSLGLAIGGGLGNFIGGWLFDISSIYQMPGLPWFVFCCVGLLSTLAMFLMFNQSAFKHQARLT
ncbi:MFS transporter [Aliikangiella sp. IMCC44359]|uniref:MFS transporter n=1 Tax=Aliikangiella sp. IMCC44359 TaxID=3459125 RepID=UPI00403B02E6